MIVVLPAAPPSLAQVAPVAPEPAPTVGLAFAPDRFLPEDDPQWPGHWATPPSAWNDLGARIASADALEQARAAIAEMPPVLRQVIVLRDIEGRASSEVREALGLSPEEEGALLHRARGLVRARLERHFEGVRKP
jgi:RNA polymerase sigma-70 factor (ECF subfamily)